MKKLIRSAFDPDTDIPDLSGKVYVIIGGSAGIGYGIVAHLFQHNPAKVYLLSNKEEHADEAQEALKEWGDVDEVAKQLVQELNRLYALVCNAGLGVGVYNETRDGLDSHMQKTPDLRIVHQSSDLHKGADSSMELESVQEINQDIGAMKLYNRTKLAQILFLRELYFRIKAGDFGEVSESTGLPWINATHPGGVLTDQQNQAIEAYGTAGKVGVKVVRPFMKDAVSQGCRPALFAAISPEVAKDQIQNSYIVPDKKVQEPSKQAMDENLQNNLWRLTKDVLESRLGSLLYQMKAEAMNTA
ncbi:NAD-binding protein [Pyrenophora tritici-repentis]|nr:NAD-binding protein [Pyrenophora tritici-repentis]KAI2488253.1 NAD-binding protein [Pyrenophora tritici-repentis]